VHGDLDPRLSALMTQAQGGDRRAYERLLTEVVALVRDFVRKRVRSLDGGEEIVQDTLLSIHRHRHTYDPARPFRPWMYAIARHRLFDHVAKQRRRGEIELLTDTGREELASHDAPGERAILAVLRRALGLLSRQQRDVIQMLKLEGFSVMEIAQRTGLSESAVKVTAHRGYKKLRGLIGER
jgi:RNA polymerase sigma-70 factor (ECF subfamily)